MRIWMVNQYALTPADNGGTRHYSLARELIRRGHEVFVLASSLNHYSQQDSRLVLGENVRLQEEQGVPFLWLRTTPYPEGRISKRVVNMIGFARRLVSSATTRALPPPHLVIGSNPHLLAVWAARRLAYRHQAPWIMEVRDLWPQTFIDLGHFSATHPAIQGLRRLERSLALSSDHLVHLPPRANSYYEALGVPPSRMTCIPNGVDLEQAPVPADPPVRDYLEITYAGSHGMGDALETIVDAAQLLQVHYPAVPARFRFLGDGPGKAELQVRAQAARLRNVTFDPPVPKYQVPAELQRADALIVTLAHSPLYRWGISFNKLFDYLAAARPIIFGGAGVANDMVAEAGAGFSVAPEDPAALAETVVRLAEASLEKRREMGLRGRDYVEQHHSIPALADAYEEACEAACAMHRSRRSR